MELPGNVVLLSESVGRHMNYIICLRAYGYTLPVRTNVRLDSGYFRLERYLRATYEMKVLAKHEPTILPILLCNIHNKT